MQRVFLVLVTIAAIGVPLAAGADPLSVRVRRQALFGNVEGALIFRDGGIEFQNRDPQGTRRWAYDQLTRVVIDGPRSLRLRPRDDTLAARLCLGTLGRYSFRIVDAEIEPAVVEFLLRRVSAPVVSKIVPRDLTWAFRLPARHERRRHSSNGELRLSSDGSLAYVSGNSDATRFWRRRDIARILALDDDRLQIEVTEARGARPKAYVFKLEQPLSADAYNLLWSKITRGGTS